MNDDAIEITGGQVAAGLIRPEEIHGDDATDTELLREMADAARAYLTSFAWCEEVLDSYFGGGLGGIFAIFLFRISSQRGDVDSWIWVMFGDVPPAYLPISDAASPSEAYETYVRGMSRWVERARRGASGTPEEGIPPVDVPATPEWAERVGKKLHGLSLTVRYIFEDLQHVSRSPVH